jgi:hypothetical protein
MGFSGLGAAALALIFAASTLGAVLVPPCSSGARSFLPCELTFERNEANPQSSGYRSDLLRVEFRSPSHKTYLMHAFGERTLKVRFSPTEAGTWAYHVLSDIGTFNDKEETFAVADSGLPGMVSVANLRHWRYTNKRPHLWLAASVPFLTLGQAELESWLDARKHDGFTHIRGPLLTGNGPMQPFGADNSPNPAYFDALDDRLLAAASRGFTLDLLLADREFLASGFLAKFDQHEPLVRFLAARYGGLNVTWQGIEHFEEVPNSRAILKDLGTLLQRDDGLDHPRSTDARDSGFPLLSDGWMNYLIEASPNPQLGAVEHQFTEQPEVHVISSVEPDAFRHELWNCTTNGEYPNASYESLKNEANLKAVQAWVRVLTDTRHWELEPFFDVDGARAVGLIEVEYVAYAQNPGIVELTIPKHKYNPVWVNPISGEQQELKDYRGEVFSRSTPDNSHDWVLLVPRDGEKENRLKYYYFESEEPPVQEIESDTSRVPFAVTDPAGDELKLSAVTPYAVKITRANRASRRMQYAWWGEVVASGVGLRLMGLGPSGTLTIPPEFQKQAGATLNLRCLAINANGKAYEVDRILKLNP